MNKKIREDLPAKSLKASAIAMLENSKYESVGGSKCADTIRANKEYKRYARVVGIASKSDLATKIRESLKSA